MSNFFSLILLLLLSTLLPPSSSSSDEDPNSFVYAGCSQLKFTPSSAYEFNVDSLLSSLANSASFTSYTKFTSSSASSSSPVYGLFQCRGDLPTPSCQSCVKSSISQLSSLCPSSSAAAIQLRGCFLRFGNDSFLGRPDTSLLFKKCAPADSTTTSGDLLGMRDSVLATVGGGGGFYRVGIAGYVQGMAQCVGDLSGKECGDCVSNAVAALRSSCGDAVSGEVYLGKCFARYWSNGVYSSKSSGGDEVGKTLAVIIGLLAAVALIIVFLSFIRRAGNGKYWINFGYLAPNGRCLLFSFLELF